MTDEEKNYNIYLIEDFYCERMKELVDQEKFDDSHAIFEEFVVDGKDIPEEWFFVNYLADVC